MSYLDFCKTDLQREIIQAWIDHGSAGAAAKHLQRDDSYCRKVVRLVKDKAALQGYAPENDMTKVAPDTHFVKGTSTLYDQDGNQRLQWVKTSRSFEDQQRISKELAESFFGEFGPVSVPSCRHNDKSSIIPWIQIGDAHLGMLAYAAETGENFDLKIAERELCAAITMLLDQVGDHERCVINDLGDATHYENFAGMTEASGHALDCDGRFTKMIPVYSRVMRFIVNEALTRFNNVDVIINQGNHSRTNDIWMAELLRVAYSETDRVNVLDNSSVFIPYRMGNTFVMTHHSDKCRPNKLANVMATDFKEDWGETDFHYIDIGHIHHSMVAKEHPGVKLESFNQLASPDKYAHDGGWRSRASISAVMRCKIYGEVGRITLPVEKVKDMVFEQTGIDNRNKRRDVFSV